MKLSKVLAAGVAAVSATAALAVTASAYNGYIGFQTALYSFRNGWDDGTYGKATGYHDSCIVWGEAATDPDTYGEDYEDYFDYDISGYVIPATYTDVTIDKDGTYTVSVDTEAFALRGESDFNLVFVSTDIPIDAGVTCTSAKVLVDGAVAKTFDSPMCDESQKYFNISLANIWNPEIGAWGEAFPAKSLAIEFTIEGLGGGAEAAVDAAEAPAAGDTAAATDSSKGSPDTGVEDVAVIGGLAILAGAAIAFTRKRK